MSLEEMNFKRELRFFGRRKGKAIKPSREKLMQVLLPSVQLQKPVQGLFDFRNVFGIRPTKVWLEIGFGGGEHLAYQAQQNQTIGIIGAEPFLNGVVSLLAHLNGSHQKPVQHMGLAEGRVDNVRIWPDDVRPIFPFCPNDCFDRIFVLYPDPWPKARHAERRFLNQINLKSLYRLLADDGELRVATDVVAYADWALEQIKESGLFYLVNSDIHQPPLDWFSTRYEQKGIEAGRVLTYFIFKKVKNKLDESKKKEESDNINVIRGEK